MEGLDNGRFGDAFAGGILIRIWAAKGIEQFGFGSDGPELHSTGAAWGSCVRLIRLGDITNGISEDFGPQALAIVAREIAMVTAIGFVGFR